MKGILQKVRRILTVLTDVLLIGRTKGWWKEGHAPRLVGKKK